MSKNLIIVESPTKASTLSKFLSNEYSVIATKGHIEDLPKSKLGIDVENGFNPEYEILKDKSKVLKEIQKDLKGVENLYIATDPDREGEAIGWHILRTLKINDKVKISRITFHEITKNALNEALKNPGNLNMNLVNAQQARRVLDRIVGYKLSPLLWKKIRYGLSAGRVQSAALNLIVKREREIENFTPEEYWNLSCEVSINNNVVNFNLSKINGKKAVIKSKESADNIETEVQSGELDFKDIKKTDLKRNPKPPYTTSTLQQDSNIRLGFSSKKTMLLAQKLYEGVNIDGNNVGLITYMRTDALFLSKNAIEEIRNSILKNYSEKYLPKSPNIYKNKSKLSQEAHEAIRPTDINKKPEDLKQYLDKDLLRLYEMIWRRALSSQMNPSISENKRLVLDIKYKNNIYTFLSSFSQIKFDGYTKVYNYFVKKDENILDFPFDNIKDIDKKNIKYLKTLKEQHFTEPPPRYNDASLIKECEKSGIGRPSTYSTIISTLLNRGYVERKEKLFFPTDVGVVVSDFLEKYFSKIVDVEFTSDMESDLDNIAGGKLDWVKVISDFYYPFEKDIEEKTNTIDKGDITKLGDTDELCPECGAKMFIKLGRYGKFLSCSRYPDCKGMKSIEDNGSSSNIETDELCPKCGANLVMKKGRFGEFYACSNYPTCKYTKSLKEREKKILEIDCPECGKGKIVEMKNKRGQIFYGCSNYPKCHFTTNSLEKING
jgi:DNA topoisomerase-1